MPFLLAFDTSHEASILVFGVPNAKNIAFDITDKDALSKLKEMGNAVLNRQLFHKLMAFDSHMRLQRHGMFLLLEINNIEALEGFPSKDDI